ncbi:MULTISPECIES: MFS transporter [unclassified Gilliamella]|uniref:MFS transporter n=1 Tax=unclassified Gilliamella TaxID=2685620 RepID=UPI0018DC2311|nr:MULTISPECIES: MFS transporter [unclassified Gilliamella]MBI0038193.1 MFS transporter [Gilliamella sp. B14384G10]MBI0040188.1 MFS transporter [Gilliamella sp. B14384G7]MBI0052028.1 MFS transporter [Gilliamella sp. B14384G13]MBI0054480.1 MFS transporter [Gilliamella sp. B14384H2]
MQEKTVNSSAIIILTSLGFFMSMIDSMIVTTATTAIRNNFQISVNLLQWLLNIYNITIAALLLVGVSLGEKIGRKKVYLVGIAIFTIASIFCALSNNIIELIISRMIQAVGACVMTPMSMAILTHSLPANIRGKALGIWSGIGGLALIVGPVLGGFIVATLSWQWIFWINLPIGIITIYFAHILLPESKGKEDKLNFTDFLLITISSAGIIWSLSEITTQTSHVITTITGLSCLVLGILFIIRQKMTTTPMIPLILFHSKVFTNGNIATFLLYASMFGVLFFLPQYFLVFEKTNPLIAGLQLLPWTATLVVIAPFAGNAVDKFGEKIIATLGLFLQGIGYLLIILLVNVTNSYIAMAIPLMIAGMGLSMAGPALQKSVLSAVEPIYLGKASGIYNIFRLFGGAIGTTISVIIFNIFGGITNSIAFAHGFDAVLITTGVISLLGIVFSLKLTTRRKL